VTELPPSPLLNGQYTPAMVSGKSSGASSQLLDEEPVLELELEAVLVPLLVPVPVLVPLPEPVPVSAGPESTRLDDPPLLLLHAPSETNPHATLTVAALIQGSLVKFTGLPFVRSPDRGRR
jgi:hypothetical protein